MDDLSDGSIRTMSDINEQEEVSKLLTAETRFVEMEEVEKAAKDYLLKQKTEFLVRESKDGPLQELRNEVIHEADEFIHDEPDRKEVSVLKLFSRFIQFSFTFEEFETFRKLAKSVLQNLKINKRTNPIQ